MSGINLIPEVRAKKIKIARINSIGTLSAVIVVIALVVITASILVYNGYQSLMISSTKKDITKLNDQMLVYKDLENAVVKLQDGLTTTKSILTGDNKLSLLFSEIEKATPSDVKFNKFAYTPDGVITCSLSSTGARGIDRFINSFSQYTIKNDKGDSEKLFNDVSVTGYIIDGGNYTWDATMKLNQGALWN